jgi:hypothetical protein
MTDKGAREGGLKPAWQEALAWAALPPGWYRHHGGGSYVVFAQTVEEGDGTILVHYFSVVRHTRWTRTLANFSELLPPSVGRKRFEWWRPATSKELAAAAFGSHEEIVRVFGSPV